MTKAGDRLIGAAKELTAASLTRFESAISKAEHTPPPDDVVEGYADILRKELKEHCIRAELERMKSPRPLSPRLAALR